MKREGNAAWRELEDDDEAAAFDHASYILGWRDRHRAAGLCLDCTTPVIAGHSYCAAHLRANVERMQRWRARRK